MATKNPTHNNDSALSVLKPRTDPEVPQLIADMKASIERTGGLEFLERMERNHGWRYCQWADQFWSGRKDCPEGKDPRSIFPWPGASDSRVPLIDEIINERVDQLMVAFDLTKLRIGPRDLSPDADKQNQAALWGGVADYYADEGADGQRTAVHQWVDWAEEFGHALLFVGWEEEQQLEKRSLTAEDLTRIVTTAALQAAEQQAAAGAQEAGEPPPEDGGNYLTEQDAQAVATGAQAQLSDLITDPAQTQALMALLMQYDPDMPESEARRVATGLRGPEAGAEYYAPYVSRSEPEWRALMPMVDVFYPPETRYCDRAKWIAMPEWVTAVQLEERAATLGYDAKWVDRVKEQTRGRAFDFSAISGLNDRPWLVSGGYIGCGNVGNAGTGGEDKTPFYQIVHLYYRATCLGGVPAMYHTVLHPEVPEVLGLHECCEHAHGKYPFRERVREPHAKTLMASRGVGEVSFTSQTGVKIQRDMRADNSSMQLLPPAEVPARMAGGRVDLRPGRQIPRLSAGSQGGINWLKPPGDPTGSEKVEADIMRSLNSYWARGVEADPEVKLTRLRVRVASFLGDVREVWKLTFQLIQQYSPDEIRAACVAGLPVSMQVSRQEIQGQISLGLTFDPADLNMDTVLQKLKILNEAILPLDRTGSLNMHNILRAAVSALLPAWTREVMPNAPEETLRSEQEDEDRVLTQLLAGQEQPYIPGNQDHKARLQVLLTRLQTTNPDGSPTRIQRTAQENPDVLELIQNRIKFHQAQLQQQQNANTGRIGVQPIQTAPAA